MRMVGVQRCRNDSDEAAVLAGAAGVSSPDISRAVEG